MSYQTSSAILIEVDKSRVGLLAAGDVGRAVGLGTRSPDPELAIGSVDATKVDG